MSCLGKIGYPTKAEAEKVRRHLYEKRGFDRKGDGREVSRMNAYHCKRCGKYHLGRAKRDGLKAQRHTPDHWKTSQKSRAARYRELIES